MHDVARARDAVRAHEHEGGEIGVFGECGAEGWGCEGVVEEGGGEVGFGAVGGEDEG